MPRISLGCYTIRLLNKRTRESLVLGDLGIGLDLMAVFTQFLQARKSTYSKDDESQKLLRVLRIDKQTEYVGGIVETGEYGYEADLLDVGSSTISYRRSLTDSEMVPYYFLAHLPAHRDEGVILLQRRSNLGIRTALLKDFLDFFGMYCSGINIEIKSLIPPELLNEYLHDGRLTKVRLIKYELPQDLADAYDTGGHREIEGTAEMSFKPGRGLGIPLLNRISEVLDGKRHVTEMIEVSDFDYNNVKVELEVRGSRKTLDLSDVMKMSAYVDVTQDVEMGNDGHPIYSSMDGVARELMNTLLDRIGTGS